MNHRRSYSPMPADTDAWRPPVARVRARSDDSAESIIARMSDSELELLRRIAALLPPAIFVALELRLHDDSLAPQAQRRAA